MTVQHIVLHHIAFTVTSEMSSGNDATYKRGRQTVMFWKPRTLLKCKVEWDVWKPGTLLKCKASVMFGNPEHCPMQGQWAVWRFGTLFKCKAKWDVWKPGTLLNCRINKTRK